MKAATDTSPTKSALAIAAVTAVLKSLLENGLVEAGVTSQVGGDVVISAQPPDRISVGADERPQLNLFLYQMTPSAGLRSPDWLRESDSQTGVDRLETGPMLAVDLHYLVSAYGSQDLQIEVLLGYALQMLQRTPSLSRGDLQSVLASSSSLMGRRVGRMGAAPVPTDQLADQLEAMKVSPQFLSAEEMSRIWGSLQARYRPSIAYRVSAAIVAAGQSGPRERTLT